MTDNIDDLLRDLAYKDSGWHRVEHPVTRAVALFPDVPRFPSGSPEQRALESDWEARALTMHASQEPLTIAPKPNENALAGRVVRAD